MGHRHGHRHGVRGRRSDPGRWRQPAGPYLPAEHGRGRRRRRAHGDRRCLHRGPRGRPAGRRRRVPAGDRRASSRRGPPRCCLLPGRHGRVVGHARLRGARHDRRCRHRADGDRLPADPSTTWPGRPHLAAVPGAAHSGAGPDRQPHRGADRVAERAAAAPLPPLDQLRGGARCSRWRTPVSRSAATGCGTPRPHRSRSGSWSASSSASSSASRLRPGWPAAVRRLPAHRPVAFAGRGGHGGGHRLHRLAAHRRHLVRRARTSINAKLGILGASVLAALLSWVAFRVIDRVGDRASAARAGGADRRSRPIRSIPRSTTCAAHSTPR